ncbi:TPA: sulfurtransferase TusA family protein [Pseudomonas aeruginosa]|nr:sulfurtransferase TusA family protein [Pseudomonas aeruginosa]
MPPTHQVEVDARGLHCPIPLLHTKQALNRMSPGEIVKVVATDAGTRRDFAAHCTIAGHTIKHSTEQAGELTYWIERGQL